MKQLNIILLTAALVVVLFFLLKPTPANGPAANLPWQIELHDNGSSTVFGITLGVTSFTQAGEMLGINREVAVLIDKNDRASLEMYYSHFKAGPLAGKLVITADASAELATQLAEQPTQSEYLGTGTRKFTLPVGVLQAHEALKVSTLTFLPSASLDHDIIIKRFGTPERIIEQEESQHYLYPEKGLDVVLNKKGKETLQYIAPKDFELLRQPLQQLLTP